MRSCFLSQEHASRFAGACCRLAFDALGNEEVLLLYGLTAFSGLWQQVEAQGLFQGRRLRWRAVEEVLRLPGQSAWQNVLLYWLLVLGGYEGYKRVSPLDLRFLDEDQFHVVRVALLLMRYGWRAVFDRDPFLKAGSSKRGSSFRRGVL